MAINNDFIGPVPSVQQESSMLEWKTAESNKVRLAPEGESHHDYKTIRDAINNLNYWGWPVTCKTICVPESSLTFWVVELMTDP